MVKSIGDEKTLPLGLHSNAAITVLLLLGTCNKSWVVMITEPIGVLSCVSAVVPALISNLAIKVTLPSADF